MTLSMIRENPANPAQPMQAAAGPPLAESVPPTMQPEMTGFHTSCLALWEGGG
jgi:hypothetical protein